MSASRRTSSPAETERLGEALASQLEIGDVLVLTGPLGAGKTCFVQGLARGLEVRGRVRSPSFTLVNEYKGRVPLWHLDLYRLDHADDTLGLEEAIDRAVVAVEWGEKLPSRWRAEALELTFEREADEVRRISASATGGRGLALLAAWNKLVLAAADRETPSPTERPVREDELPRGSEHTPRGNERTPRGSERPS